MKIVVIMLLVVGSLRIQATNLKIVVREDVKSVLLSKLEYGKLIECKKLEALKSGSENVIENIESGQIYVIKSGMLSRYFCAPDDGLEVVIKEKQIELIAPRGLNLALNEWYLISDSVRCVSSEFSRSSKVPGGEVFFDQYKELENKEKHIIKLFHKQLSDEEYEIFYTIVKCDMDYFLCTYCWLTSGSFDSYPDFVKHKLTNPVFNTVQLLKHYPYADAYLSGYVMMAKKFKLKSNELIDKLTTDDLKAFYCLIKARELNSYEQFLPLKENWNQYFTSEVLIKYLGAIDKDLKKLAVGAQGFDFALPDVDGKIVHLSDFKGKLVLVDLWATWCGPCMKEMPHLKKIKEEFKDANLVVIGIAIDKEHSKANWKNVAKLTGGIQLLDSDNTIGRYYKRTSIPQFFLFDKKGKIVLLDSPRPSNPRFKDKLRQLLEESN